MFSVWVHITDHVVWCALWRRANVCQYTKHSWIMCDFVCLPFGLHGLQSDVILHVYVYARLDEWLFFPLTLWRVRRERLEVNRMKIYIFPFTTATDIALLARSIRRGVGWWVSERKKAKKKGSLTSHSWFTTQQQFKLFIYRRYWDDYAAETNSRKSSFCLFFLFRQVTKAGWCWGYDYDSCSRKTLSCDNEKTHCKGLEH